MKKIFALPKRVNFAFSLVEMLMALLVASLLMAALAPVMTKKINEHITVSGTGGAIIPKVYCAYVNDSNELLQKLTEADGCIVPDNSYNAGIIIASGGGGGGGAADMVASSSLKNLVTATGGTGSTGTNYNIQTKTFDKSTKNILIKISGAGAGGGGGNFFASGYAAPSENNCRLYGNGKTDTVGNTGENFATYDGVGYCVTKFNQINGGAFTGGTCWTSYTNTGSNCSNDQKQMAYYYPGCSRAVCTHDAAENACKYLAAKTGDKWKLPGDEILNKWNTKTIWLKLALCSYTNNFTANCNSSDAALNAGQRGEADCVWSANGPSTSNWNFFFLNDSGNGTWTLYGTRPTSYPQSVRCVLEETQSFTPYVGGGGGSGSYVELNIPSSVISEAVKNDEAKIITYAGFGGKGGTKENASSYGGAGSPSKVEIYDGTTLLWSLTVPGGNPGVGASKSSGGTNGKAVTENCIYFDKTNENYNVAGGVSLACNLLPVEAVTSGGASVWAAGSGTSTYGKGGNGTTCEQGTNATDAVCADGNSGEGGRVEAWHSPTYPGIGGGGGAAGTVLHVKNVQVRPKDLIKVQVGHGGAGGSINAKGTDGGSSYVEITRGDIKVAKYEVLGGGGGLAGVSGNPDTGKLPEIGKAGAASKLATGTKTDGGEVFPKNSEETVGTDAVKSEDEETSVGGNGGINPKTSPLASNDAGLNGIPCGGLNTGSIVVNKETTWQCTNTESNMPFALSRSLSDKAFNSNIIQNLAAGSTGGGGGAWKYSATPRAQGGAKGLGGYVFIYFGDWGDGE